MRILYESDLFVVVWVQITDEPEEVGGFEIVDKIAGEEVFLHGPAAIAFTAQIEAWEREPDTQEMVEARLIGLTKLGRQPLVVH
jgi:hypothetical protein